KIKDQPVGSAARQSCSSFIVTGNWTKGGNVVLGHNTMQDYVGALPCQGSCRTSSRREGIGFYGRRQRGGFIAGQTSSSPTPGWWGRRRRSAGFRVLTPTRFPSLRACGEQLRMPGL